MQAPHHESCFGNALIALAAVVLAGAAAAQAPVPLVKEGATVKISEHVHVIPDGSVPLVPNVGFIVGTRATLVVDTGMGRRNGETVMRELAKVSRNSEWYIATTHFHPEHSMGTAFPASAQFIYPRAQQQDIDEFGAGMVELFTKRSPEIAALLSDARYPHSDRLFEREQTLDLGGVHVRLMWLGPTHTRGDTAIFVEEDRVLFAGDLAMKRAFPAFASPYSSGRVWLRSLDALDALHPLKVVGSHGEMGDAALISDYRGYLKLVDARVRELKSAGTPVAEAEKTLTAELQARYPDWAQPVRIAGTVQAFYSDR